ncbi:uncharacterized protein LOC136028636 [Artemia franciscana]|uniref:uncharacterized protein LOC136028636 n=1 Tax=Artemia franciscana TaxID=6661 RepID=UPI0032DA11A4
MKTTIFVCLLVIVTASPVRERRKVKAAFLGSSQSSGNSASTPIITAVNAPTVSAIPGGSIGLPSVITGPRTFSVPSIPASFPSPFSNAIPVSVPSGGGAFVGSSPSLLSPALPAASFSAGSTFPGASTFSGVPFALPAVDTVPVTGFPSDTASLLPGLNGGFSFGSARPVAQMEFFIGQI